MVAEINCLWRSSLIITAVQLCAAAGWLLAVCTRSVGLGVERILAGGLTMCDRNESNWSRLACATHGRASSPAWSIVSPLNQ